MSLNLKFCPKCDNFLMVKRKGKSKDKKKNPKYLTCGSCGHEEPFEEEKDKDLYTLSEQIDHSNDKTAILLTTVGKGKLTEEERDANEWLFESGD